MTASNQLVSGHHVLPLDTIAQSRLWPAGRILRRQSGQRRGHIGREISPSLGLGRRGPWDGEIAPMRTSVFPAALLLGAQIGASAASAVRGCPLIFLPFLPGHSRHRCQMARSPRWRARGKNGRRADNNEPLSLSYSSKDRQTISGRQCWHHQT